MNGFTNSLSSIKRINQSNSIKSFIFIHRCTCHAANTTRRADSTPSLIGHVIQGRSQVNASSFQNNCYANEASKGWKSRDTRRRLIENFTGRQVALAKCGATCRNVRTASAEWKFNQKLGRTWIETNENRPDRKRGSRSADQIRHVGMAAVDQVAPWRPQKAKCHHRPVPATEHDVRCDRCDSRTGFHCVKFTRNEIKKNEFLWRWWRWHFSRSAEWMKCPWCFEGQQKKKRLLHWIESVVKV